MRIAIVGAREFGKNRDNTNNPAAWTLLDAVFRGLIKKFGNFTLISGGAAGADAMAAWKAKKLGLQARVFCLHNKPVRVKKTLGTGEVVEYNTVVRCDKESHEPQEYGWSRLTPAGVEVPQRDAGFKRNQVIVDNADAVVAFIHEQSKGTRHTVHLAQEQGKTVYLFHAYTGERLNECPCEDEQAHARLKNSHIYQTVMVGEGVVSVPGPQNVSNDEDNRSICSCPVIPHFHTLDQHVEAETTDWDTAIEHERECSVCGREQGPEGCEACAREFYGEGDTARVPLADENPDVTGRNYYIKTVQLRCREHGKTCPGAPTCAGGRVVDLNTYVPDMPKPERGATKKRLVNGHWLITQRWDETSGKIRDVYATKEAQAAAAEALKRLPPGKDGEPKQFAVIVREKREYYGRWSDIARSA